MTLLQANRKTAIRGCLLVSALALLSCSGGEQDAQFSQLQGFVSASAHSIAVPEGDEGALVSMPVRVSLTRAMNSDTRFSLEFRPGTAIAGRDYLATTGELVIPAGQLSAVYPVDVIGNSIEQSNRQFSVQIHSTEGFPIAQSVAVATIANDDTACLQPPIGLSNRWLADDRRVLNYAHRGGVIDFPENTLYAYKKVAAAGADVLEMDVYETADGELVILHDLDVDRTTNGTGLIGEKTLAEIRNLDAAYWFVQDRGTPSDANESEYLFRGIATGVKPAPDGFTATDFRIPTLEEALQAFPNELINVELKPDLDGTGNYEAEVARLLQQYGRFDDVIVASFVDEAANNFKAQAPCFPTSVPLNQATALVLGSQGPAPMSEAPEHVALQVPPDTRQIAQIPDDVFLQIVTEDLVNDAHTANLAVHVWTVNDCEQMLEMLALGVDAIMTDRPLLLEKVLAQSAEERSCEAFE